MSGIIAFIIIGIICYAIYMYSKNQEYKEKERKRKEEIRKRNIEREQRTEQWRKNYEKSLCGIYDGLSTETLRQIYPLLQTMHYNKVDFINGDCENAATRNDIYYDAQRRLLSYLSNPRWLLGNNYQNTPTYVDIDMNYVYRLIKNRGY